MELAAMGVFGAGTKVRLSGPETKGVAPTRFWRKAKIMTVCFWGEVKALPLEIILSPLLLSNWRDFLPRQNKEGPKMALALVNYMGGQTIAVKDLLGLAL